MFVRAAWHCDLLSQNTDTLKGVNFFQFFQETAWGEKPKCAALEKRVSKSSIKVDSLPNHLWIHHALACSKGVRLHCGNFKRLLWIDAMDITPFYSRDAMDPAAQRLRIHGIWSVSELRKGEEPNSGSHWHRSQNLTPKSGWFHTTKTRNMWDNDG